MTALPAAFLNDPVIAKPICQQITSQKSNLEKDSVIKICRQVDFFYARVTTDPTRLCALTDRLLTAATRRSLTPPFQVPKVRFGRTNIQMPIITCGGMQLQQTWFPDDVPLLSLPPSALLSSPSQQHLLKVIRTCLRLGISHFETARFYGTSEYQFCQALKHLMDSGEVRRQDIIFQTKILPSASAEEFDGNFAKSWKHIESTLGYVDLLSFHGVNNEEEASWVLPKEGSDNSWTAAQRLREEGKVKFVGFSTHGPASVIFKLIDSRQFDYVNLHYHYFGSYHAEGTSDTLGGHGNGACVERALELDMGVFNISPFDKGGMLYKPSHTVARLVGEQLTPIAFAALYGWKTSGMHTISVGVARLTDLDEVLEAAAQYAASDFQAYDQALSRLEAHKRQALGEEWLTDGLLNLPTCFEESTDGVAIGHVLWLHNLMTAFGMLDFCRARYKMLEGGAKLWAERGSYGENNSATPIIKCYPNHKRPAINAGRYYDPRVDLTDILADHYDEEQVRRKLEECHEWLRSDRTYTEEERRERGWDAAYSLTTWKQYPGSGATNSEVILQAVSRGRMGVVNTGPTVEFCNSVQALMNRIELLAKEREQ